MQMVLPKINLLKKSSSEISKDFIACDLTKNSAKMLYLSRNLKDESTEFTVKGVSVFTNSQSLSKEDVKSLLDDCQSQSRKTANDVIVGLSGSEVFGFVLIIKLKRDYPDKEVTQKEISDIYEKIKDNAYNSAKKRWTASFAEECEFEALDLVITGISFDNEIIEDLEGKTGNDLQISIFCSYCERCYFESVTKMFKALKLNILAVTTTLYSQSKLFSENSKNYVLVDIGSNHTDVAVILGKNIIQTKSFEMGSSDFSFLISKKLGLDFKDATGKKEAYSLETLHEDETDSVGDILYECGKSWRNALGTTLNGMTGIKSFPGKIILSGGGSTLSIIEELLYEDEWADAIPFSDKVEVIIASQSDWSKRVKDDLNLLLGPKMVVPISVSLIRSELET